MTNTSSEIQWALDALSVSNLRAVPDHASELVSQVLMGTPLQVLDFKDKFFQVLTPEQYLGWIDAQGLQLLTGEEIQAWKSSNRYLFNRICGQASTVPGINVDTNTLTDTVTDLVLGDLFEVIGEVDGYLDIRLPDGRKGFVSRHFCLSFEEWCSLSPDADALLAQARQMMGFPYLWGGASSKASDCSGFTKLVFYSQGIILARDASQQARFGGPVDISNIDNLMAGDLLFFGVNPERPGHVGIHLGGGDFIHSSGRVHISSVIPGDPKHDPNRIFRSARRILNSLDTEGITRVKNHPWFGSALKR